MIEAEADFYREHNANAHRGIYTLGEEATEAYEQARATIARFLGAADPARLVFTRGTTEAINLVALGWARPRLREGDEILLTEMEHHSNIVPWQLAAQADRRDPPLHRPDRRGHARPAPDLGSLFTERTPACWP